MKPSAEAAGEAGGGRPRGGDVDRHGLRRLVVDRRVMGAVVLALESRPLAAPERLDQLHGLPQAREPLALLGPVDADGHLVERLPRADAQDHAPRRQAPERREGLGDDRRVVAERRGEYGRAEDDPLRCLGRGAQPGERVGRVTVGVAPGLEVVGRPDRVEPRRPPRRRQGRGGAGAGTARRRPCSRGSGRASRGPRGCGSVACGRIGGCRRVVISLVPWIGGRRLDRTRERERHGTGQHEHRIPATRNATSRRLAASPSAHRAPHGRQQHRRFPQRRHDGQRCSGERRQHEPVRGEREQPGHHRAPELDGEARIGRPAAATPPAAGPPPPAPARCP